MLLAAVYCIWLTGLSSPYVNLALTALTNSIHGSLEEVLNSAHLRALCCFFLAYEVKSSMCPVWWTHFFDDWQGCISLIPSILVERMEKREEHHKE